MSSPTNSLALLLRLACSDLWHDRKVSFCIGASLVAVIAPLLLLFGLKYGVVNQLQEDLLQDPRNLEIKMLSSGNYTAEWIEQLQQQTGVGFAIGQTRSLNTQADLIVDNRRFVENAEVIPTAAKDPLLNTKLSQLTEQQTILSATAAQRLNAQVGDTIRLRALRKLDNVNERGELELQVVAILDPARFSRPAAFVSQARLISLEQFRDGAMIADYGITTGTPLSPQPSTFSKVRIYAAHIDAVKPIIDELAQQHIETSSRLAEIENVKAINKVLGLIFAVIALTALIGCIASLIGAFLANIDRKRKDLAVLRLLGFTKFSVAFYVVIQALLITLLAYVVGLGLYSLGSELFNSVLVSSQNTNNFACKITFTHGVLALLLAVLVAVAVSSIGALRAIRIQPAESLREL